MFAAQFQDFVGQFQMRFAVRVRFDVTEITRVPISRIRRAMVVMARIKMSASRGRFRIGAIAKFVDVESVFSWRQTRDVGDYLHFVAQLRKRNRAVHVAAGCGRKNRDRVLSLI